VYEVSVKGAMLFQKISRISFKRPLSSDDWTVDTWSF